MNGKGDTYRPVNKKQYDKNYERIFRKGNTMKDRRMTIGNGDVYIGTASAEEGGLANILVLAQMPKQTLPIGSEIHDYDGKKSDSLGNIILLTFTNPESVQVMIDALERVKGQLN